MNETEHSDPRIPQPERWTLLLGLYPKSLCYAIYCPAEPQSLITAEIDLNPDDYLRSLEDAVYDNPVLLSDFGSVRVVCQALRYIFIPQSFEESVSKMTYNQFYSDDNSELTFCPMPECNLKAAFPLPDGVDGFLQRTFNNPPILLHLVPVAEYLMQRNSGSETPRMYVNIHHDFVDIILYRDGKLALCNTYPVRSEKDVVYYVINIFDTKGLAAEHTEVHLSGDSPMREPAADELRQFIRYVMPLSYPTEALQISRDIATLPLHLTLLALCES